MTFFSAIIAVIIAIIFIFVSPFAGRANSSSTSVAQTASDVQPSASSVQSTGRAEMIATNYRQVGSPSPRCANDYSSLRDHSLRDHSLRECQVDTPPRRVECAQQQDPTTESRDEQPTPRARKKVSFASRAEVRQFNIDTGLITKQYVRAT